MSVDSSFFASCNAASTTVEVTFGDDAAPPKHGIGYWSIRGLGAPLTMMMCAAQEPFTLFLYDLVEDGEAGWKTDYFAAKKGYITEYKQPLWNLPFCIDRVQKRTICQTNAVFAHLGRSCGMLGTDAATTSECEQLLCEIYDLRDAMLQHAYSAGDPSAAATVDKGTGYLKKLEAWLELQAPAAGDQPVVHLVGGTFSAPDFHLYEMLDQFEALASSLGQDLYGDNQFTRLQQFKTGFAALEKNQLYLNSWLHKELPFNNTMARFGSLPGPKTYVHGESAKVATWRGKGVVKLSPP